MVVTTQVTKSCGESRYPVSEKGNMTHKASVAHTVMVMLKRSGVETIFGLPGVHNLAFWRDGGDDTPRIMGVRHEQTTVYAADGAARTTRGLGVALTTTGPGAANAVAAFGEAAASGSPVLLIASEISTRFARRDVLRGVLHESSDQAALFEPLAKAVFRPRTAVAAVVAVAQAITTARSWPQGPVYVDIPTDVLDLPASSVAVDEPLRRVPSHEDIERAAQLIDASSRIVIWAGGGVVQSGAEEALQDFAELLGAPVVTTFGAPGAINPDHRSFIGLPPHEPEVAGLIGVADLLLAVGTDFDGMTTRNWSMKMAAALLSINCDATDLAKNYVPDVAVYGDAKLALEMLSSIVQKRGSEDQDSLVALRESTWARLRAEPASSLGCQLVGVVDTAARAHDGIVIADMAIAGYWVGGYGHFAKSCRLQYPVGWGTLGYALPASIGAAAVSGRPVLAVCGDGGVMFALGELAVLRQENLPVTVLIVDDGGYGMLRYDQRHSGDEEHGVDLVTPDFAALAEAFGIKATTMSSIDGELAKALDEAMSSREPRVLVLRATLTPPRTTSPRWHE